MDKILKGLAIGLLLTFGLHHGLRLYNHYTFEIQDAVITFNQPCNDGCQAKGTLTHGQYDGWYRFTKEDGGIIEFSESGGLVNNISTEKMTWYFDSIQKITHSKK